MLWNWRYTNCHVTYSRMWFSAAPLCNTATCPALQAVPNRCPAQQDTLLVSVSGMVLSSYGIPVCPLFSLTWALLTPKRKGFT